MPLRVRLAAGFTGLWLTTSLMPALPPADSGRLPVCEQEDGSSGPLPCRWDGGPNGQGLHYVIGADGSINYRGAQ